MLQAPLLAMSEIDKELGLMEQEFPYLASELKRTWERQWILDYVPNGGVGAEVGVFRGRFSEVILSTLSPRKMYFIDPWELIGEFFWNWPYFNDGKLPTKKARRESELRVAKFPNTASVFIEDYFPGCVSRVGDLLDFIYIDASHQYEETLAELRACATLVKPDGLILGDDFVSDRSHDHYGVSQAVNEFIKTTSYESCLSGCHPHPLNVGCIHSPE